MNIKLLILGSLLISCGSGNNGNDNPPDAAPCGGRAKCLPAQAKNPVDWSSIPSEFNPSVSEETFAIDSDLDFVDVSISGINIEIAVRYDNSLSNSGMLKIYRVYKGSANFGYLDQNRSNDTLVINNYTGRSPYSCSRSIQNRRLTRLEGGCNLYAEVILPFPSIREIEVYSNETLISPRFFPMSISDLATATERGFNDDKYDQVEEFLDTYDSTGKTPSFESFELESVLQNFSSAGDYQIRAFGMLHKYVTDRENLEEVIDNVFSFRRERLRARRIARL